MFEETEGGFAEGGGFGLPFLGIGRVDGGDFFDAGFEIGRGFAGGADDDAVFDADDGDHGFAILFDDAHDGGGDADRVEIIGEGFFFVVFGALGEDGDAAVFFREVVDEFAGGAATDGEGDDHAWEEDGVADGEDGEERAAGFGGAGGVFAALDGAGGGIDVDDQSGSVGGFFGARGIWFHGERVGTRAEQGAM